MTDAWWQSVTTNALWYCLTVVIAHLAMSFGQTVFHRHLGHRRLGGRFFKNHMQFHHTHYSGDHLVSVRHIGNEGNNTPYFLLPTFVVVGLTFFVLRFDLFLAQVATMSLSFYGHVYLDKQYHVEGSWLCRFSWFKRKQQLHFLHHRYDNCNFAVVDYFWDRIFGTYRRINVS